MTSNIGSSTLLDAINADGIIPEYTKNAVMDDLKIHFRPEFINRVDEIVMFKPLSRENMHSIIDLIIEEIRHRLEDRNISLEITGEAKDVILDKSYTPAYGARPLKRFIQKVVETDLGRKIITGEIHEGSTAVIDSENGELEIRVLQK
jgi:ATP-dependent Clp protease ATP-binding subunit ClpB